MTYQKKILDLVASKKVSLIHIISPPRTVSTFFEISLAEGVNGNQINEPFLRKKDAESAYELIYNRLVDLGANTATVEKPVKLIIKDVAKHIINFSEHILLIDHFIFLIRDPHAMMPSFILRLAHTVDGKPGENYITSYHDAFSRISGVDSILSKSEYTSTSWKSLEEFVMLTQKALQSKGDKTLTIIDAALLRHDPEEILQQICKRVKIKYCDTMLQGEKKAGKEKFYYPDARQKEFDQFGVSTSAWIGDSVRAESYLPVDSSEYMPASAYNKAPCLKEHLKDIYGIYSNLVFHSECIKPTSLQGFNKMFHAKYNGEESLAHLAPTTYWSHASSFINQNKENLKFSVHELQKGIESRSTKFDESKKVFLEHPFNSEVHIV